MTPHTRSASDSQHSISNHPDPCDIGRPRRSRSRTKLIRSHQPLYNSRQLHPPLSIHEEFIASLNNQDPPPLREFPDDLGIPYLTTPDLSNMHNPRPRSSTSSSVIRIPEPKHTENSSQCSCNDKHTNNHKTPKGFFGHIKHKFTRKPRNTDNPQQPDKTGFSFIKILRRAGKHLAALSLFLSTLAGVLTPLRDLTNMSIYDFASMQFPWHTNPRDHLLPFDPSLNNYNVLMDGHAHTTESDGRLTPEQLVDFSVAQGYNALIVTDHNTIRGGIRAERYALEKYPGSMVVIPGMEYSNCRIHMNFININHTVSTGNKEFPSDTDIQNAINRVHDLGGLVIVNHIPWSNHTIERLGSPRLINHPSIQDLISWGVDGFEIINQATFDMPTYQHLQKLNSSKPLIMMTGSDVHTPSNAYAWTVLRAKQLTKDSIMDEIRNARTSFLFDPTGNAQAKVAPNYLSGYLALAPLAELSDYFESFYDRYQGQYSFHGTHCQRDIVEFHGLSVGCFVAYFISALILFELIYYLLGVISRKIFNKQR